jgi:predicted RNase H-like nuclease
MFWVAGVDGCAAGWFVVLRERESGCLKFALVELFADILMLPERPATIAVDMPIGLLDRAVPGGRSCDPQARKLLGPLRASSVFTPPVRPALWGRTYFEACAINAASSEHGLRLSRQSFGLFPKLRQVDKQMTPDLQSRVFEIHPEVCFAELNGGDVIPKPKRTQEGVEHRKRVLREAAFTPDIALQRGVETDDVLDACAACWTATRIAAGTAARFPFKPDTDSKGLRMEMWR